MTTNTSERGIHAAGVYLPRGRVSAESVREAWGTFDGRGIDFKRVPAGDEDALTMGVAAARRALGNTDGVEREEITTVAFATTTPPLAEEGLVPRVARALGLSTAVRGYHHGQHTGSGADALETAFAADGPALAVAADAPQGDPAGSDHAMGAGAAAFLVDDSGSVRLTATASAVDESPGVRVREADASATTSLDITGYERNVTSETVNRAIDGLGVERDAVDAAALHQPNGSMPYRIAGSGLAQDAVSAGVVVDRIGDAGAATVPIGLVSALETDGERTLAGFFGSGSSGVAMAFEGSLPSEEAAAADGGESVSYVASLRKRGLLEGSNVAGGGANVSIPNWRRTLDSRYLRSAGKCPACGALSFPGEGACDDCHERVDFERVPLAEEGSIAARTVIGHGGAPPEFVELQQRDGAYGAVLVEIPAADGDGSVTVPGQLTDCDPTAAGVGDRVHTVVRRIYTQEGVHRYGAKFVPAE